MRAVLSVTLMRLEVVDVCSWVVYIIESVDTFVFLVESLMIHVVDDEKKNQQFKLLILVI